MADLGLGQTVPYFELPDQQDYPWGLSGQLEVGPVVLVFYRGDWCPYCNGQLAGYARGYEEASLWQKVRYWTSGAAKSVSGWISDLTSS